MDTSTPVRKQKSLILPGGLRRKAMENDCDRYSSVSHSNDHKSPEEDAELVYSQPTNDTRLDRSEELFPFSPIPFRKEVPSTLLPLLDSPDIKWTSSLFTSFPAQSENASPEVLSEDNFVRTICIDSHVDNNARYTTNSFFNSEVPGFSNDTNNTSVQPQDSYVERNSNRPSPPLVIRGRKEKKFSSVTKELFPFRTANDEVNQEQSPSLECGAMGDMTLNALEQICVDSEIMYSKNSSIKSNTVATSFADEATSHFVPGSVELGKSDAIQPENKRNFIYPFEKVKKPVTPVLMTDILQTVLSLETNETSTKVPRKKENFRQGLVRFSQLEPSLSQTAENSTFPLPLTVWCEAETENSNLIAATYEIVRIIYLPVFFSSSVEMSSNDRDMLAVLKRYFECHRVRFAQLISECRPRPCRDLSFTFIDCSRSKFPHLNFSAAIIDSFFEFFNLHPDLIHNYRLSRRFCISSNQTTKRRKRPYFSDELQPVSRLFQSLPSVMPNTLETYQSSMKLDPKLSNASPTKSNDNCKVLSCQKINEIENELIDIKVPGTEAVNQNQFSNAPMRKNEVKVSREKSEPKITDEEKKDCAGERLSLHESTFASYKKEMLELGAAFITASEQYNCVDTEVIKRAKKLLEDITSGLTRAPEMPQFEKSAETLNSVNSPRVNALVNVSEKSNACDQNSAELFSKIPFDVDIDSADLMFICDLSEKSIQPEKSLNSSDAEPFSRKIAKVTENSPQHPRISSKNLFENSNLMESPCSVSGKRKVTAEAPSIRDQMKYSNFTVASTGFSAKSHHSPTLGSKSTPVMRPSIKKCTSESSRENSAVILQKPVLDAQAIVLDDIENWNPEVAAMMTPVEIKKQLIHTRSNKKDIGGSCSYSENKFAFDAFNTAGGRKISVKPNSLVRAKKSMDAVQIESEMVEEQFSNRKSVSSASVMDKVDLISSRVDDAGRSRPSAENSSCGRVTKPANNFKLVAIDDGLQPQFSTSEKTTSSSFVEDSRTKIRFTANESLNQMLEPLNVESYVNQFPTFSTASGKMMSVSEKFLAAGKKIYESTAEDKSIDEIKPNKNDPPGDFNVARKMQTRETKFASAPRPSEPKIFKTISVSPTLNKFEAESHHQLGGFCSAAGKKLMVAEKSLKDAEKLYASVSNEEFFESAQDQKFASFSSASGKKIGVSSSLLEKGRKLYESTLEETKLCDSESTNKKSNFSKPAQLVTKTAKKMSVADASLQKAHKLFEDCFDNDFLNEFTVNHVDPSSRPQLSTFTSAAGKTINVAEKKLFDAQKILQSVSAETVVSMEKIVDFSDDFLPCRSKVPSNSKPSDVDVSEAAPSHHRLKRSLNDDSSHNLPSYASHMGKKMKTNEDPLKAVGKSEESVEKCKLYEENLVTPPSNCVGIYELESVSSSRTKEERNSAVSGSEPSIDPKLPPDTLSICSGENDIFQKSPSLDDAVLTSDVILSNTDIKTDSDFRTMESAASVESNTTLLNLTQEISESTSAFLHDMKNDNLAFDPVHSHSGAVDEPEAKTATPQISRSSSPVFDSCKPSHRKRYRKRKSQHSLSLNPLEVTYVRKESDNAASKSTPEEIFEMFNQNFAQKVNKRKEPSSNMMYPSSKKAKDSNESDSILEQRKQAAIEQQKRVSQKDEQLCKPRVGSILAQKLRGDRKSLREMVNYANPQRYPVSRLLQFGLKRSVVNVNADNAHEFIFTADFLSGEGATYGDECVVIPNEKHEVYFEDLARAFLASPGVDPRLISLPWIRNHYRWIIWKLASTEKSYPNLFGGRYLTLDNVLLQLKFRYDWEVDRCCRSALKRILECDSSPSETMILCVASVKTIVASLNEYEIEMTDGWYSVPCLFDGEMLKLLTQKKVTVGTKLMIMNAEMTGAGEGCDPLQANPSARLKIATNSVRRARWYAPLGFHPDNPIVISDLRAILPNGGTIPQLTAVIARVYPMLYLDKKDDGSSTLQNEKVHFKKMSDFEKRRQMCLESLVSQITSEVERENPSMDSDDRNTDSDSDPIAYQNRRYHEQERLQILIQERVKQKLPEEFKTPKRASSLLKVRLINKDAYGDPLPAALLTIWHPPEDLVSLLSEGKLYEFHKVAANGLRNGQIQLTTNRLTKYKHLSAGDLSCYGRRVTSFCELKTDFKAAFGEVDVVGLVISVKEIGSDTRNDTSSTIYLADLNKNLMIVKFRTNVKDFGFEDSLKLRNVIAGLNLSWKRSLCYGQIPIVYASELTSFVHTSRCQHLQKCIDKFHSYFKNENLNDFVAECQKKLTDILASVGPVATSTPERSNLRTFSANDNSAATEPTNDASLKQSNSADSTDAGCGAKSKNVHSRIEKLRGYGEPPPLSPISMCSRRRSSRLSIQTRVHKLSISKT